MFTVPPSGGSLEIGNTLHRRRWPFVWSCSPFGGIPRNWKQIKAAAVARPRIVSSPFGGIPRNWKHAARSFSQVNLICPGVPPSGGSLEIGNIKRSRAEENIFSSSPFGGIPRNWKLLNETQKSRPLARQVPPSGGSLEIGNVDLLKVIGETI